MHAILFMAMSIVDGGADDVKSAIRKNVVVMTSEKAKWQARCDAEDALKNLPGKLVLAELLPHISKGMPSGGIWNSGGRVIDKQAPVKWQIFYAAHRSWNFHRNRCEKGELADLFLNLLQKADSPNGRQHLLDNMTRYYTPKAEPDVAKLLRDGKMEFATRRSAGFVLMLHEGKKYHDTLRKYATIGSRKERTQWIKILLDPRHKRRNGIDPKVTELGFRLLIEEKRATPNYIHGAYFIACDMESYLGVKFRPDQKKKQYQGKNGGLNELFFEDTVTNALAWWASKKR